MPTERRAHLMDNQRTELQPTHDQMLAWKSCIGLYQILPGLRGFWPGAATSAPIASTKYIRDYGSSISANTMQYYNIALVGAEYGYSAMIPFTRVAGANAYCSAGDRPDYQITGTESYIQTADSGLTFGAWWYWEYGLTGAHGLMGKDDGATLPFSYYLEKTATHTARFITTQDGTNRVGCESAGTVDSGQWNLIIGRFSISASELAIFLNGVKSTVTTGVPSFIYDSGAAFRVGYNTQTATGDTIRVFSMAFVSAMYLRDYVCQSIWHHTRAMFGR